MSFQMTHMDYEGILQHKREQAKENRQTVLNSMMELAVDGLTTVPSAEKLYKRKYVSNKEIEHYLKQKTSELNQRIKEDADKLYKEGQLTISRSQAEKDDYDSYIKDKNQRSIDLRTIQRWTKALAEEGLLSSKLFGKEVKFTLTDLAIMDIRNFAEHFGYLMFQEVVRSRINDLFYKTMSEKVKELVTLYGSYILFCLIEGAKPIDEDFVNKFRSSPISAKERDRVAALWIEDAINPFWLFRHFLEVIQNHPGDRVLKELSHLKYKGHRNGKAVYVDKSGTEHICPQKFYPDEHLYIDGMGELYRPNYRSLPYPTESFKYSDVKNPRYEINKEKVKALTHSFKRRYPAIYRKLSIRDVRGEKTNLFRGIPEL